MKLIFSDSPMPTKIKKSIFLAGPSPRNLETFDWRVHALKFLKEIKFDGTVFIPIPKDMFYKKGKDANGWTYTNQINWECLARRIADKIIFWVPRNINGGLPGYTTNVEFGEDLSSGKISYGRPDDAEKCRYLDKRFLDSGLPVYKNLDLLIKETVENLGVGSVRRKGEVYIPLFIWNCQQFKIWYKNLQQNGNTLIEAKLLHHFKFRDGNVYSYILWVNVWVESEQRYKDNEFIFARKDVSSVLAYYKNDDTTYLVLVKEFRSPVNNKEGFVYELPGGSASEELVDPKFNAQTEFHEEVGLLIEDLNRFKVVGERQLVATVSSHQASVYKVQLTKEEFEIIQKSALQNTPFGIGGEMTYVTVIDIKKLKKYPVDYSCIGMICEALMMDDVV